MTTPDNHDTEIEDEAIDRCNPGLVDFLIRFSHCYCEWGMVIGLAFMGVSGLVYLEGDTGASMRMFSVGIFAAVTGCIAGKVSCVVDEGHEVETENVTLEV